MSPRNYNKYKKFRSDPANKKSKLCCFGYVDYIVLASSLAVAIAEELNNTDVSILSTFFAVLADELALIGSVRSCPSDGDSTDDEVFVPPVPDVAGVAATRCPKKIVKKRKKIKRKKVKV